MERENTYSADYNDMKDFTLHQTHPVNGTSFGTAVKDHSERGIDLNEQLVMNKNATFFFRMNSDAMTGAGIFSGDILIVDRSITETNGKVVIAVLNGDMMVRRLERTGNRVRLIPETHNLSVIDVDPFSDCSLWGVVVYAIHSL